MIWTQEYLRYRVNQCDHPTAVQKVFSQIDGGGVAPTCFVPPCIFTVTPTTQTIPAAGGTFTAIITKTSGDCIFGAESLGSFVSLVSGTSGTDATTTLTYTGRAKHRGCEEHADSRPLDQQLDAARDQPGGVQRRVHHDRSATTAPDPTTTCLIRTTATPCVFTATGTVTGTATYSWVASYQYGALVSHSQSGTSPNFTFTQTCGGPGSTAGGTETALNVTLTVTDANGTTTVQSGSGSQPPLIIKFFTC